MNMNILVVDDNEVVRRELSEWLIRNGNEVKSVESGEKALEMAKKSDFNLMLIDLKMPGMDGIEVVKSIKSIKPHTQAIMITGYGSIDSAVEAMKLGFSDYICKPFEAAKLKSVLEDIAKKIEKENNRKKLELNDKLESMDAFEYFRSLIKDNDGLCITKISPDIIKERYGLDNISILWLTSECKEDSCIDPQNIYDLKLHIEYFLNKNPNGVILFDCLGTLIEQHSWEVLRKFIHDVLINLLYEPTRLIINVNTDEIDDDILFKLKNMLTTPYLQLISESLSGPIRRNILKYLYINEQSTFTGILKELDIENPPKLSFHLRKLVSDGILQKNDKRIYSLTKIGKKVAGLLESLEGEVIKEARNNVSLILDSNRQ